MERAEKLESRWLYALFVLGVGVLGFLGSWQINRLTKIETQLAQIQVDIVSLQAAMLDEDKVRQMIEFELLRHGVK